MKRFALLLEVLIAMVLMSFVITALLSGYSEMMFMQGEIQRTKKTTFENLYTQFRLGTTLSQTISSAENDFFFYTAPDALLFSYDNGTGAGPIFSNTVIGKIALNKHRQLTLTTWPSPKRAKENPPSIQEILMEGIEEIRFSFFRPPVLNPKERETRLNKGKPVEGGWTSEWALDNPDLPAIIKISIKREGIKDPILFSTVFGNTSIPVTYP